MSRSHLAICEGDDGIPLWLLLPLPENVPFNTLIAWLDPYEPLVVVMDRDDGTSLVLHDGLVAYAVTECLIELF